MNGNIDQQIIAAIINTIRSGGNPQAMINNMANQNPNFRNLLNQKNQNGMSWKDLTIQLAKQNNVDLKPYISGLTQNGINL